MVTKFADSEKLRMQPLGGGEMAFSDALGISAQNRESNFVCFLMWMHSSGYCGTFIRVFGR